MVARVVRHVNVAYISRTKGYVGVRCAASCNSFYLFDLQG
jgi:hypothetical protein